MKRIGVYGGSFDPIHLGHINLANTALLELELEKLIIMPSYIQPFKRFNNITQAKDRLNMLMKAFDNQKIEVSTYEIDKEDISYTYDTLSYLKTIFEDYEIIFILGTDSYFSLESWFKGIELLSNFSFAVASRPGFDLYNLDKKAKYYNEEYDTKTYFIKKEMLQMSSSNIRNMVKEGIDISLFVPNEVKEYIYENGLYKD